MNNLICQEETSKDTVRQALQDNKGRYAICEFSIGSHACVKQGVIMHVGQDYFTLLMPHTNMTICCDLYALKFATCYPYGAQPNTLVLSEWIPEKVSEY